jgi:hypothetical protein
MSSSRFALVLVLGLGLGAAGCGRFTRNEVMQINLGQGEAADGLSRCWAHAQQMGYPVVDGDPGAGWFRVAVPSTKYQTLFRVVAIDGSKLEVFAEGAHVRQGATMVHKKVKRELEHFAREMGAVALVAAAD